MRNRIHKSPAPVVTVLFACAALAACGKQPPARTVVDFEMDRAALDAKLVSCRADRRAAIDDIECQNARVAANRIARAEEAERRARLERNSERQLEALRRQRAAADAQQRERQAQLVRSAESKIAQGLSLTEAEARAIGVDPANSVLADGDQVSRFTSQPAGPAGVSDANPVVPVENEADTGETDPQTKPVPAQRPAGDGPASLAEIRESLREAQEADDEDAPDDDE